MIKKYVRTGPKDAETRRAVLLDIIEDTLDQLQPQKLLAGRFNNLDFKAFRRVVVISIGKAATAMAEAARTHMARKPDAVFIADKGHPLPTLQGVKIAKKIIEYARTLTQQDLVVVLISGGGSAMCVAPVNGITLADKIATTRVLLRSGATIREVNIVRKHLSQVKGGNLARLLYPATVRGLVISDVVGNDLGTIASGPLSPDKSTFADAKRIIKKYKIMLPKAVKKYIEKADKKNETPKPGAPYFKKVKLSIVANHTSVANAVIKAAKKHGLRIKKLAGCITGEARDEVKKFIKKAAPGTLLVGCGETTVTCRGNGFGGRNQEFVLAGLPYLKNTQTLAAVGTDGMDGMCPELVAGALGDRMVIDSALKKKLKRADYLARNDSYTFFKKAGGHIKTGLTSTNLGDVMLLLSD